MTAFYSNRFPAHRPNASITATIPQTAAQSATLAEPAAVARSRHFSTSTKSGSGDEKTQGKVTGNGTSIGAPTVHPLRNTWVFWFRQQRSPGNKITNYEEGIKKVSAFSSVESFWSLWTHLHSPSLLLPTTDYLLFHSGVRRPVWEDPLNLSGGKYIIRLRKGVADRLWEDLVLAVIGDQFDTVVDPADSSGPSEPEWPEVCGCTVSVRQGEDIVSLWIRHDSDAKSKSKIKETIRRVLNLPPTTIMEYKSNNDSMQDKSSFRVNPADRTPLP